MGSGTSTGPGTARILGDRLGSFLGVLGTSALLLSALLVTAAISALGRMVPSSVIPFSSTLWWIVTFVVSWAFLTLAVALVFHVLPDVKIAWRDVWIGAGATGLLFLLGNHLIGWYLAVAGVTSVYGAASSVIIVLLWVYYSSQAVLFGAEFTRVYAKHRSARAEPEAFAIRTR